MLLVTLVPALGQTTCFSHVRAVELVTTLSQFTCVYVQLAMLVDLSSCQ